MNVAIYSPLIFFALIGFLISLYVAVKKRPGQALICPLRSRCDLVIHSDYSRFLGIPLEILGMAYYGFLVLGYGAAIFLSLSSPDVLFALLILSFVAAIFSLYLTFIQFFVIKELCTWCLTSAVISVTIFAITLSAGSLDVIPILAANHRIILGVHLLGVVLGLGGATITDIFFFKFLKDYKISREEADVLHTLSQVIWFGLALLVLSGIGLYLPEAETLNHSSKFLVKMVAVAVIIINGSLLNLIVSPRLVKISFGEKHHHTAGELHRLHRFAFALGAISITSWYAAFILGLFRSINLSFGKLLAIYLILLVAAVAFSQLAEKRFPRRDLPKTE